MLHGEVSREMFAGLWPGFDTDEVPIGSITNGVHAPTWVAREVVELAGGRLPSASAAGTVEASPAVWEITAASCAPGWSPRPGAGCASPGGSAAPRTPS